VILVVDDEEGIRNAVGALLQDHGFAVILCADAPSALEQLQQLKLSSENNNKNRMSSIDCIVSDVRMPGPSGLDLVQTVRHHLDAASSVSSLHTIPVVLLTAAGRPNDRIAGYQAGADAYLPKPFDPEELVAIVRRLVHRQRISMTDIQTELDAISKTLDQQQQQQANNNKNNNTVFLVPDEAQVLAYICDGATTKEIAAQMFLSTRRIEQLLTILFRKANVKNRTELIRWAVATGKVQV
jgi:DNA-binding NarL/FixJ family response regulator